MTRLVHERWGGGPAPTGRGEAALERVARRHGWSVEPLPVSGATSYTTAAWRDRFGGPLGWTLLTGHVAAVSTREPEFGLPPTFHLTSNGPLHDALSADGQLTLPDADWLTGDLTPGELVALLSGPAGGGWEAYSVRYWRPRTRAEVLFNHWD